MTIVELIITQKVTQQIRRRAKTKEIEGREGQFEKRKDVAGQPEGYFEPRLNCNLYILQS